MNRTVRRRRQEGRTDYKSRLALLKSQKPRLVVRKTNRYMTAQIIVSETAQDSIAFGISSKKLLSLGWPKEKSGSLKNLTACYLTGYVLGKMAKSKLKETSIVLDIGMHRNIQKSRIYAVLKGFIDSGFKVPHDESALPKPESFSGEKAILEKIKGSIKEK